MSGDSGNCQHTCVVLASYQLFFLLPLLATVPFIPWDKCNKACSNCSESLMGKSPELTCKFCELSGMSILCCLSEAAMRK